MPDQVAHYSIFISSPGDVQEERDIARKVIEDTLPKFRAFKGQVAFEAVAWDDPLSTIPMLANETPQESVNRMIKRPADCDIVVVILWSRMGTPLPESIQKPNGEAYQSGTEWEYLDARYSPKKPHILIYRRTEELRIGVTDPDFEKKRDQFLKVNTFFEPFRNEDGSLAGGVNTYTIPVSFEKMLYQHLEGLVWEDLKAKGRMPQSSFKKKGGDKEPYDAGLETYLSRLRHHCQLLPLAQIGGQAGLEKSITLNDVYIGLSTATPEKPMEKRGHNPGEDGEQKYLSAREAAERSRFMVLLGDPGSGKSTFVKQITAQLADQSGDQASRLVPVFVTLRDLAPRLGQLDRSALEKLSLEKRRKKLANEVLEHVIADLESIDASGASGAIRDAFRQGRVHAVFDGLDEVPYELQHFARDVVDAAVMHYEPEQVIVTCRIRSYTDDNRVEGFDVHTLAPFDDEQIAGFIEGWYEAQVQFDALDQARASALAANLKEAVQQEHLRILARNPMLLTTMILVHQQETELPRDRVVLYQKAVDILLRKWQQTKGALQDKELDALLGSPERIRPVIERLAFEAHQKGALDTAADLPRLEALEILESTEYLGCLDVANRFLNYVDERSGLLVGRGGTPGRPGAYSFPHRTFQEYLAGCYLIKRRSAVRDIRKLAGEGSAWTIAVQLGAEELLINRLNDIQLLDNASQLLPAEETITDEITAREALWSAHMAAVAGRDAVLRDEETGQGYLSRVGAALVKALGTHLPPVERAEAGRLLGQLGDPRKELLTLEAMPFCYVPAGPFMMGDDTVEVDVPYGYWISQYPVTNAQFDRFEKAGGYEEKQWWTEGGWAWLKKEDMQGRMRYREPYELPNHPVVLVSWYEAFAFTQWLSAEARNKTWIEETTEIKLPNEPEWEKGARGGLKVPEDNLISSLRDMSGGRKPAGGKPAMKENVEAGRAYPWGGAITMDQCNYGETGIGTTSTPGCFPEGVSPYGVQDLSGNVWEWTRSKWERTPYQAMDESHETREAAEGDDRRVLRGGSFGRPNYRVRCAARLWLHPYYQLVNLGFRLVALPRSD